MTHLQFILIIKVMVYPEKCSGELERGLFLAGDWIEKHKIIPVIINVMEFEQKLFEK